MEKHPNLVLYYCFMFVADLVIILSSLPANLVFSVSFIFSLPFIVASVVEINSADLSRSEKTDWTVWFIGLPLIAGLIYLISSRKKLSGS